MTAAAIALRSPEDLLVPADEIGNTGELPDPSLSAQVAAAADKARGIAPTRVYALLTPGLCGRHPHTMMQWLRDTGLLARLIPELEATVTFAQEGERRHKDVWEHTKTVVRQAVPRSGVRWAAALHDIGKVTTRRFVGGGKVTFHGHAEEGVRMFRRGVVKRIGFPDAERELVEELIRHHLRAGQYDGTWTDAAVRRFHREMAPFLRDLLDLSRADVTSRRPGKRMRCLKMIHELENRIDALAAEDAKPKALPPGLGNTLMEELSLPPGKHLAQLRDRLAALCEAGELEGGRDAAYYLQAVRERNLLEGIELRPPRGWRSS